MTISQFHIDGSDYTSYASLDEANKYLRPDSRWTAWNGLADDEARQINLVLATRLIDQAGKYSGSKVNDNQPAAFPRMDIKCNGVSVTETLPMDIVNSCILLAGTLAVSPLSAEDASNPADRRQLREIIAGPVEIAYFHSPRADLPPDALTPDNLVDQVIKCYFKNATSARPIMGVSFGASRESSFSDPDRYRTSY